MTQPLTPDILVYDLKTATDPQISPDGQRVIYTLASSPREQKKPTSQIWLCDRDGANARQLIGGGEQNGSGRWSPDGSQLAFVSDRKGDQKDAKGAGLYVLPIGQGGEAREVTRHAKAIRDLDWSPDGHYLAYCTLYDPANPDDKEPDKDAPPPVRVTRRLDYKQDGRGYLHDTRLQVFIVNVATGERRRLTGDEQDPADYAFPQWSPNGKTIAAMRPNHNGMQSQLALLDVVSGGITLLGPEAGTISTWSWSPDGTRLLFSGDTRQTYQADFFLYTVATGETKRLTDDLPVVTMGSVAGMGTIPQPVWLDEQQVLFLGVRAGGSGAYIIDCERGSVEPVKTWQELSAGMSVSNDHRYLAMDYSCATTVGEIAVTDLHTDTTEIITHYNDAVLAAHQPSEPERFTLQRGKYEIEYWVLKPANFDASKQYPLVLNIHGGPNGFYGWGFNALQQALAAAGFVVAYANPRGSSSYGREFTQQVIQDWGFEDYQDLMAVVDKTLELPYVNRAKLGVAGYSYGGYMTSWIIGQTTRFQAAVCGAPCFDLESFFGTSDIGHTFGRAQFGAAPHEDRDWYAAHSPSSFIHQAKTPTLIIHGEEDHRCPIGQGEQMFIGLLEAGVETEFARYPGGAHGFASSGPASHRADFLTRTVGWFTDHL